MVPRGGWATSGRNAARGRGRGRGAAGAPADEPPFAYRSGRFALRGEEALGHPEANFYPLAFALKTPPPLLYLLAFALLAALTAESEALGGPAETGAIGDGAADWEDSLRPNAEFPAACKRPFSAETVR